MRAPDKYLRTVSGRKFWPLDPRAEDVYIEDIAHALAHNCRWGGHCREFYSVAQHAVCVADFLPPHLAFTGLMHDASEAYLLDLPRPIKRQLPDYEAAENRLMRAIADRFRFAWPADSLIKTADNLALFLERVALFENRESTECLYTGATELMLKVFGGVPNSHHVIQPLKPNDARELFLERFIQLSPNNPAHESL